MKCYSLLAFAVVIDHYIEGFSISASRRIVIGQNAGFTGMNTSNCQKQLSLSTTIPNMNIEAMKRSKYTLLHSSNDDDDDGGGGGGSDLDEEKKSEIVKAETSKKAESYFSDVDYADADPNTSWVTAKRNKPPQEELIKFESEEWRRWRMIRYYEIMTLISSAFCFLNPLVFINGHDKYYTVAHKPIETVIMVCGDLLLVLLSRILRGAVTHDRLSSDTYKRLNLVVVLCSALQLYVMRTNPYHSLYQHSFDFGTAPFRSFSWIWTLSHMVLIYTGLKGFAKGVRGFDQVDLEVDFPVKDLIEDIIKGAIQTTQSFVRFPNPTSVGYFGACAFTIQRMFSSGMYSLPYLVLASSTLFTLKDASDRGRLDGGTFASLNGLVSISSFAGELFILNFTLH